MEYNIHQPNHWERTQPLLAGSNAPVDHTGQDMYQIKSLETSELKRILMGPN